MKTFTRIEPTVTHEFGNFFKRQVVIKNFQTEDGLKHEFSTFQKEGSVGTAVIALTADNKVVICKQFRPGREEYCYDLPGGMSDGQESPEATVKRELLEETGYQAGQIERLGRWSWGAYDNFITYYFIAFDCIYVGGNQLDQFENEQGAETVLITIPELLGYAKSDMVCDAVAILYAYDTLKEILERGDDETTN